MSFCKILFFFFLKKSQDFDRDPLSPWKPGGADLPSNLQTGVSPLHGLQQGLAVSECEFCSSFVKFLPKYHMIIRILWCRCL